MECEVDLSDAGVSVFGILRKRIRRQPGRRRRPQVPVYTQHRARDCIGSGQAARPHRYLLPCVGFGANRKQSFERHPQLFPGSADLRPSNHPAWWTWRLKSYFFDEKLDIVGGRINALDDFATSPLYCFAQNLGFCGNPLSIPVNASVPSYPGAAWGIRARYQVLAPVLLDDGCVQHLSRTSAMINFTALISASDTIPASRSWRSLAIRRRRCETSDIPARLNSAASMTPNHGCNSRAVRCGAAPGKCI